MQGLIFKAGETYHGSFTVISPNTMQLKNADTTPTITATRNNTLDAGFSFSVTNPATGEYTVSGTIPAYSKGDNVQVFASATVDGMTEKVRIGYFRIDTKLAGDLKDFDYTAQECKLISDYNAAKTAATQSSVNAIPTTPLLANDNRLNNLNAPIGSIPTTPLLTNDSRLDYLDGSIAARATQSSVDMIGGYVDEVESLLESGEYGLSVLKNYVAAIPINPLLTDDTRVTDIINYIDEVESILKHNAYGLFALKTLIDAIPTNPLLTNDSRIDNIALMDEIKAQTDKLLFDTDSFIKANIQKGSVVFPPLNMNIPKNEIGKDKELTIKRGDTRSVPINLNKNCTGWTGIFGARRTVDSPDYAMPEREVRWEDQSKGTCFIDLSSSDTGDIGIFLGEIELRMGLEILTSEERIKIKVVKDIVRP